MSTLNLILTAVMMSALALFMLPGIFAMNRGKNLQTIALWLAIFVGLGLIYKNFGPDSPHPLFHLPDGMSAPAQPTPAPPPDTGKPT